MSRQCVALAAALCLIGALPASAAEHPRASGKPLWNIYPLDTGVPTSSLDAAVPDPPPTAPAPATAAPPTGHLKQKPAPASVVVLFYGAVAILVVCAGAMTLRNRAPRGRNRTARG